MPAENTTFPLEPPEKSSYSPEEMAAAIEKAEGFLNDVAPHLGRLFGMDLEIQLGEGWATDMDADSNIVTADPRFFIEKGFTPEMSVYATLHEVAAHLREKITEPKLADRIIKFIKQDQPQAIFHNIFSDIAGNNLIHAVLPSMSEVAKQLYREKLFSETDYSAIPRHLQFLYKIIRQEMIPESETRVLSEVDDAIDLLRNFQERVDLIKYSTAVAKSERLAMRGEERFDIWVRLVYPVYEELIEQDRKDPNLQRKPFQGPASGEQQSPDQESDHSPSNGQFDSYYRDYQENRHPEPMGEEEQDNLHTHAKKIASDKERANNPVKIQREHEEQMEKRVMAETGHSLRERRTYDAEIIKWQDAIREMREVYSNVINRRIAQKRGLSRRNFSEGVLLDPERLAQTVIDVRQDIEDPEAFKEYAMKQGIVEVMGETDYVLLLDTSSSMRGEKAKVAGSSSVIFLEGFGALQRDIESAETEHHTDLGLDIRTAVYTFGDSSNCIKALSTKLTPKERLDSFTAVSNPKGTSTKDYLALEEVNELSIDSDRRKIVVVLSDGGSWDGKKDTSDRAKSAVNSLRANGWFVYGISIGSEKAELLYRPTSRRVDDPAKVPKALYDFIETTISI
jgi:Mg-chelatase subunit ChlD